jgi:signal transduction histidine kinase
MKKIIKSNVLPLSIVFILILTSTCMLYTTKLVSAQLANKEAPQTKTNSSTSNDNNTNMQTQENKTSAATAKTNPSSQENKTSAATAKTNPSSTSLNRSGFAYVYNLTIGNTKYPIKYNTTGGNLLGIVADKGSGTLVAVIGSPTDGGKLLIELPRNVIDAKGQGSADAKYAIKIEGKGVDYKEIGTNIKARILQIDFGKDDKVIEITGTQMAP